jgi:hypothetical protein
MTDLISTPIDTDEGGDIAAGQLQHLPPQTLVIGDNVRTDAKIDADFLASIRQHGVLMPITAVRDDDGRIMVRDGQRRIIAKAQPAVLEISLHQSVQAGLPDGQHANVEIGNFEWVNVDADYIVADFCQTGATDQTYIASAKDGNFHGKSLREIRKKK